MNRNIESHFSEVPYIDKPRSIFDMSHGVKTSGNVGDLIPLDWMPVLPGDTWKVTTSKVIRLQTLLTPIYDNLYADFYHFFIPYRLIFNKTKEFFGENTTSAWVPSTTYRIPAISAPNGGFETGTIADYLGLPVGVDWSNQDKNAPMALPMRAYAIVCDQYFRDENLTDPLNIPIGDSDQTGTNGSSYINDVANGGKPFKVAKFHDRFTSALPSPQRAAAPVSLNIVNGLTAPVLTALDGHTMENDMHFGWSQNAEKWITSSNNAVLAFAKDGANGVVPQMYLRTSGKSGNQTINSTASGDQILTNASYQTSSVPVIDNFYADLTDAFSAVTVNELRLAFQMQRYYEQLARGGSRYIEYMRNFYGVTSPDARLQRAEYLGGNRVPISIDQVTNTSQSQNDFLGDLGAQSWTSDINDDFEKSFTEFGVLLTCCCLRYDHSYSQGISRKWTRRDLFDQYVPTFAHIGEQPIYTYELFADGNMDNNDVFGYQEAWSDYRYAENIITGELRPGIQNSLASWHLGDYYIQAPTLSDSWIREDKNIVDRVLAVGSSVSNQFFADIWFKNTVTRVMPMYSVPGLIDHF